MFDLSFFPISESCSYVYTNVYEEKEFLKFWTRENKRTSDMSLSCITVFSAVEAHSGNFLNQLCQGFMSAASAHVQRKLYILDNPYEILQINKFKCK